MTSCFLYLLDKHGFGATPVSSGHHTLNFSVKSVQNTVLSGFRYGVSCHIKGRTT